MPYEIEHNVVPPRRGELAAVLRQMFIGDSVAVESRAKATSAIKSIRQKRRDLRFSVRKTETGIRVWRIA